MNTLDPAASIEVTTTQRLRARVRLDAHPAMDELTVLTFTADNGTRVELAMSPENLHRLGKAINLRLAALPVTLDLTSEVAS